MSRIYFHTPTETVEVYGTERAHMGVLCSRFAVGLFDMLSWEQKLALLPDDWRSRIGGEQLGIALRVDHDFGLFVRSSDEDKFANGCDVFATVLNTVQKLGSPAMQLAARIHGQCEIHGYVEPKDGEFIAATIERGIETGVFRETHPADASYASGWREACRVLRAGEIVVTSYSVCDSFPNAWVAVEGGTYSHPVCDACGGDGKPNGQMKYTDVAYDYCTTCGGEGKLTDAWYDLPASERWDLAVRALREGIKGLRWQRDGWDDFYFGNGTTALTISVEATV